MGDNDNIQNEKSTGNQSHGIPGRVVLQRMNHPASVMSHRPSKNQKQKKTASELEQAGFQAEAASRRIGVKPGVKASGKITAEGHQRSAQTEHIQILAETSSQKMIIAYEEYNHQNTEYDIGIYMKKEIDTDSDGYQNSKKQ